MDGNSRILESFTHSLLAGLVSIVVIADAHPLDAECAGVCGDVNGTGGVTLGGDWAQLMQYVLAGDTTVIDSTGGAARIKLECADVDGHLGVNAHDLQYMAPIFSFGGSLDCVPDTPVVPTANAAYFLHYNSIVPPGDTSVMLYFDVSFGARIRTLSFTARILVDSQEVDFGSIDSSVASGYGWEAIFLRDPSTAPVPPSCIRAGFTTVYVSSGIDSGRYPIGTVQILLPSSPVYRTLSIEFTENPPGDNAAMIIEKPLATSQEMTAWKINLAPHAVGLTGDSNNDRLLTAADVIGLVNYVFKGGKRPHPVPATGDTNCSGQVTSSDIILLVSHVFRGGPAPCDVEAECSINLDQWTCP